MVLNRIIMDESPESYISDDIKTDKEIEIHFSGRKRVPAAFLKASGVA